LASTMQRVSLCLRDSRARYSNWRLLIYSALSQVRFCCIQESKARWACIALLVTSCFFIIVEARAEVAPNWTYSQLLEKSDVVVIARYVATEKTGKESLYKTVPQYEVCSTFEILGRVKGETRNQIRVCHYLTSKDVRFSDGPYLVDFHEPKLQAGKAQAVGGSSFMLFLKKNAEGRFTFTSGPLQPGQSAQALMHLRPVN